MQIDNIATDVFLPNPYIIFTFVFHADFGQFCKKIFAVLDIL